MYKNRKNLIYLFLSLFLVSGVPVVFAQEDSLDPDDADKTMTEIPNTGWQRPDIQTGLECSDYYKFGSVVMAISGDRAVYKSGEGVRMYGKIINQTDQPILDAYVFARFSKLNSERPELIGDVIDEFIPYSELFFKGREEKEVSYDFHPPKSLPNGRYRVTLYFSVAKQYNLSGLPFTNDIKGSSFEFDLKSDSDDFLHFDRKSTTVNGEEYPHVGAWPSLPIDGEYIVKQDIVNEGTTEKDVQLTYSLFFWDSLRESDLIESKIETVKLAPGAKKTLEYKGVIKDSVNYLRIIAESEGGKAIVNVRVTSPKDHLRLNYPALATLPFAKGEKGKLFTCFYNATATDPASGTVQLILSDEDDKELLRRDYSGFISGRMLAIGDDYIADRDHSLLKVSAKIFDEKQELSDSFEVIYDCNTFGVCSVSENVSEEPQKKKIAVKVWLVLVVPALIIILITLIIRRPRNKKNEKFD
jgi:hypothetical protein